VTSQKAPASARFAFMQAHRICRDLVENDNSRSLNVSAVITFRKGRIVQAAVMSLLRKRFVGSCLARGSLGGLAVPRSRPALCDRGTHWAEDGEP
jgi:hypothetical protein